MPQGIQNMQDVHCVSVSRQANLLFAARSTYIKEKRELVYSDLCVGEQHLCHKIIHSGVGVLKSVRLICFLNI